MPTPDHEIADVGGVLPDRDVPCFARQDTNGRVYYEECTIDDMEQVIAGRRRAMADAAATDPLRSKVLSIVLTGGDVHTVAVTGWQDWDHTELDRAAQELAHLAAVKRGEGLPG